MPTCGWTKPTSVSAKQPGRLLAFELGQGDLSFRANLEKIVDLTSWTTGEAVEVVGIDRGGLSQNVLERFEERGIGLLVWSNNTSPDAPSPTPQPTAQTG